MLRNNLMLSYKYFLSLPVFVPLPIPASQYSSESGQSDLFLFISCLLILKPVSQKFVLQVPPAPSSPLHSSCLVVINQLVNTVGITTENGSNLKDGNLKGFCGYFMPCKFNLNSFQS